MNKRNNKYLVILLAIFAAMIILGVGILSSHHSSTSPEIIQEELGFTVEFPAVTEGKLTFMPFEYMLDNSDPQSERIKAMNVVYGGRGSHAHLIVFEEMSTAAWEKVQQQAQEPAPVELGTSEDGRVVIMHLLENPYPEKSPDYPIIEEFLQESSIIKETFRFTE